LPLEQIRQVAQRADVVRRLAKQQRQLFAGFLLASETLLQDGRPPEAHRAQYLR
jgi:hypothetical protein